MTTKITTGENLGEDLGGNKSTFEKGILSNIQSNKDIECILEFGDVFKILIETFEENIDKILNKVNVDEYDNELLELLLNSGLIDGNEIDFGGNLKDELFQLIENIKNKSLVDFDFEKIISIIVQNSLDKFKSLDSSFKDFGSTSIASYNAELIINRLSEKLNDFLLKLNGNNLIVVEEKFEIKDPSGIDFMEKLEQIANKDETSD